MKSLLLEKNAVEDFEYWSKTDLKMLKRIAELLLAVIRNPFDGIGKPEPLKGNLKGYWSRRINDEHRIVYTVLPDKVIVISCRSYYKF
jgi:toxin YoeB